MINSKTKYQPNESDISRVFERHSLGRVEALIPFGGGEFNTACRVDAVRQGTPRQYVVKLSPPADAKVLTYEKHMMSAEVYWYRQIAAHTDIRIPEVFVYDDSREIIPVPFFVMELINGKPLWAYELSDEKRAQINREKLRMLAQIHSIKGEYFGYYQGAHYDSWYAAIRGMVTDLVNDCEALGRETPDGHRLLDAIDRHRNILSAVPSRMVNFDLWDSNVLLDNGSEPVWIDPERSFYGDPIGDFITQGGSQTAALPEKVRAVAVYNEFAQEPFALSNDECVRYAVMVAYLALIEETEKYVRYEPTDENYIRNTVDAAAMYAMAFKYLEPRADE